MADTAASATILIVDDDSTLTALLAEALGEEGYVAHPCAGADEALAAVRAAPPDLVLLDIHLPGPGMPDALGGLHVAATLANDRRTRSIPILLVTGVAPQEHGPWAELAARQGQRVLFKPFGLADLLGAVEHALAD
jgi:CheY-like chemotaxis protein